MKIGVLTSSRADFGIYLPLLQRLKNDNYFKLEVIAFGTHLSKEHGYTLKEIERYNFTKIHKLVTIPNSDSAENISKSIGDTISTFSSFWNNNKYDLVICLGDRYEMFAAVSSGTPFNVKFAHIHAGETTLGAIDNSYRHSISLFSKILFVSTSKYQQRALSIVEKDVKVYNVGALSIDNLSTINYLSRTEFKEKFDLDLSKPTILSTFHPETVSFEKNENHIKELLNSFVILKEKYQIIITMPNTDTMGQMIRDKIILFKEKYDEIKVVESFGMLGYLSCMKHCSFLLGNTSSGFVEAAFFPKFVINLGDRQLGRIETNNILTTTIETKPILELVKKIEENPILEKEEIYGDGMSAARIIEILKKND